MEEITRKLIELVQTASPMLWELARKQVMISIIQYCIGITVTVVIGLVCWKLGFWCRQKHDTDTYGDWDIGAIVSWIVSGISGIVLIAMVASLLPYLINPKYQAIVALTRLAQPLAP